MYPLSVRLSPTNRQFVEWYLKTHKETRTSLINKALDLLRKYFLKKELIAMAEDPEESGAEMAEADMDDYFKMIEREENEP